MTTAYNVENAPRNAAQLATVGRFNLRNIATALGLMDTEQKKTAFMALSNDAMVEQIFPLLTEYDKAKGGGKAAGPATQPVRTPVTNHQSAPAQQATPAAHPPAASPNGQVGILELVRALEQIKIEHAEGSKAVQGTLDTVTSQLDELRSILRGTNRILLTSMALNLFLAEEVLKADRAGIIKTAHDDVATLITTLSELDPGISDSTAEGEEEGEGEEGGDEGKE